MHTHHARRIGSGLVAALTAIGPTAATGSARQRYAILPRSEEPPKTAEKDVHIWNLHGPADEIEPVATSRVMIEALRKAGGTPRHTEYAGVGHQVYRWAYTEPAMVDWLFAQKR